MHHTKQQNSDLTKFSSCLGVLAQKLPSKFLVIFASNQPCELLTGFGTKEGLFKVYGNVLHSLQD